MSELVFAILSLLVAVSNSVFLYLQHVEKKRYLETKKIMEARDES